MADFASSTGSSSIRRCRRIAIGRSRRSWWISPGLTAPLLLDRGGELLRALELLALEMLRLPSGEHEKISFDCQNQRSLRIQELRTAATVAAEKVRRTGTPYEFSPMSSRERRIVHLALRDEADLRTESEGEGMRRCLVVYPKDYKPVGKAAPRTQP